MRGSNSRGHRPTDLKSAALDHSANPPIVLYFFVTNRATYDNPKMVILVSQFLLIAITDRNCIVLELFMKSKHTVDITRDEVYRSMPARDKQCVTI